MASVYELANLSAMTYDASKTAYTNWVRRDTYGNPSGYGFFSELYTNGNIKEAVMAIRGTDGGDKDWLDFHSDIQIGLGKTPSQIENAESAFKQFTGSAKTFLGNAFNLYLTGHSLGGGLASLLAAKRSGLPTVTFNAPGMQRSYIGGHLVSIIGMINIRFVDTTQMLHIRATGDPVSVVTGKHMGRVEEVYVDNWGDGKILGSSRHLAQHSIENMVASLKTKYHYHKDLGYISSKV